ncbi:MAG TPA: STAS domain-containing protein [Mycobacteriales bacterium]|nr:STAS domain-containing protein [Mycobacteriales bacterium]
MAADAASSPFTLSVDTSRSPEHLVRLTGDLDLSTAPELRTHLLNALGTQQLVAVDLDGLDFIDSTGVGVLVAALKHARAQDRELALICSAARVLRTFQILGLTSVFPIYNKVDDLPG